VEALKKALLKGGIKPDLPPPAPLSDSIPASVTANKENKSTIKRQALIAKANTQKDLPSSPRINGAFWGGRVDSLGGGATPVHTTLIPDFSSIIPDKLTARAKAPLQENINPSLNANPFFGLGHLQNTNTKATNNGFESYMDVNPFSFKTLDAYRMHLWMRMGARAAGNNTPVSLPSPQMQQPDGLAGLIRPSYFSSPSKNTLSEKAELKESTPQFTPQQAVIASIASQTFMQKFTSAFWDAFSSPSSASKKDWDHEKVRKVLEGKAVVRIVDTGKESASAVSSLEESMRNLAIANQGGAKTSPKDEMRMMRTEPCFYQSLRAGTSALSGKK